MLEGCRWHFFNPSFEEFINRGGELLGCDVHGVTEVPGANVPDEGASCFNVYHGVFSGVGFCLICGEHDIGGVEREVVKLTDSLGQLSRGVDGRWIGHACKEQGYLCHRWIWSISILSAEVPRMTKLLFENFILNTSWLRRTLKGSLGSPCVVTPGS